MVIRSKLLGTSVLKNERRWRKRPQGGAVQYVFMYVCMYVATLFKRKKRYNKKVFFMKDNN